MKVKEVFISRHAILQKGGENAVREIINTVSRERPHALHYYAGREPIEAPESKPAERNAP